MAKEKRYKNRNTPAYQKKYNEEHQDLIVNANRLRRQLQKKSGLKKNPPGMDAGHYKNSKTKGRWQKRKDNARSRLKIRRNA